MTALKKTSTKTNDKTPLLFSVVFFLVLATSTLTYVSVQKASDNAAWVSHTHEVKTWISRSLSDMQDLETGQRGYLITGDESYLEPYYSGLNNIESTLHTLTRLTRDNSLQQEYISQLTGLKDSKTEELAQTIKLRRTLGFEAAKAVVLTEAGKHIMDAYRVISAKMHAEEIRLLAQRTQATENSTRTSTVLILLGNIVALGALGIAIFVLTKARRRLTTALIDANMASVSKSEFLASMSHEIRTPMNGVIGMLTLLQKESLNKQQQHYAQMAKSSAQSLLVIINDILDMSKIEAGKFDIENIEFDLKALLADLSRTMSLRAYDNGVELILDSEGIKQRVVIGDPGRLRQILTNLIGNAIKFTKQGEIVIRAVITAPSDNGDDLRLDCHIIDTGMGIPNHKLGSLFEAFTQADASTTRNFGGTGLGLSIVKNLCVLMNGDVTAQSEVDKGSQFSFNVQLKSSNAHVGPIPSINMGGIPMLVVDDNNTNLEVLSGLLEDKQIQVTACASGEECLTLLERQIQEDGHCRFEIAILDMQMPNMDGASLASLIRNNAHYNKMKLILMTSMGTQESKQYYSDLGFSGFFHKPVIDSDLYDALALILNSSDEDADSIVTHDGVVAMRNASCSDTESQLAHCENKHVLLVEDNEINQMVAIGILEDLGLSADIANNGLEALQILKQTPKDKPYALILMDCQMPQMDGYEATKRIRNGDAGIHTKNMTIVAMTANAMQGDKEKCIDAGMNDYLTKPIEEQLLAACLVKWLCPRLDKNTSDSADSLNAQQTPQVWDKADLLSRMRNKSDRVTRIVQLSIKNLPAYVDQLGDHIRNEDIACIINSAHTIKGAMANISGKEMESLSAEMETLAKNNATEKLHVLWPTFNHAFQRLLQQLQDSLVSK